jgi:hypothetical protein
MERKITLHLQQNTTLERVVAVLDFFSKTRSSPDRSFCPTDSALNDSLTLHYQESDLEKLANTCQVGVPVLQKLIFPFLRSISILSKKTPPELTVLGKVAADIQHSNPDLLGDFLHLIIYSLHLEEPDKRFSWAYATVVQQLWLRKEVVLSPTEKKSLVGEVIETASLKFELPDSEIAFSDSSISGVLNWLRSLSPTVLELEGKSERFNRRYFCAAPILIEAVNILYKQLQRTYGVKIFLREDIQERLCQILLLDPSGLDNTLDNAKHTYDYDQGGIFDWGYEGGYGQWIMLTGSPEWIQLL